MLPPPRATGQTAAAAAATDSRLPNKRARVQLSMWEQVQACLRIDDQKEREREAMALYDAHCSVGMEQSVPPSEVLKLLDQRAERVLVKLQEAWLVPFLEQYGNPPSCASQVDALREALRPYLLQRKKADVEGGLAPLEEVVIWVELTAFQKRCYRAVLEERRELLAPGTSAGEGPRAPVSLGAWRGVGPRAHVSPGACERRCAGPTAGSRRGRASQG